MIARNPRAVCTIPFQATVLSTHVETIPPMTDPMGKYWRQPILTHLNVTHPKVELTQREFNDLMDYSTSLPSGKYAGKCWKAQRSERVVCPGEPDRMRWTGVWLLLWYAPHEDPKLLKIEQREIIFINPTKERP